MRWINSRRTLEILAFWFVCGLAGCSGAGPEYVQVTGNITFKTEPLPKGDIIFHPKDPKLTVIGGTIVDGKYSVKALVGEYRVRISASREVPGKTVKGISGQDVPVFEHYIPKRYNEVTELTANVLSNMKSDVNFDLKE